MNHNLLGIVGVLGVILLTLGVIILFRRPKTINVEAIVETALKKTDEKKEQAVLPQRLDRRVIPPGVSPNPAPEATQLLSGGGSPRLGEHLLRDDRDSKAAGRSVQKLSPLGGIPEEAKETVFLPPQDPLTQMLTSLPSPNSENATRIPESPKDLWKYLNALSQSSGKTVWVCLTIQWFDAEAESRVFCTLSEIGAYRIKAEKKHFHPTSGVEVPAFVLRGYKIVELNDAGQLTYEDDRILLREQVELLDIPMAKGRFPKVSKEMLLTLLPQE